MMGTLYYVLACYDRDKSAFTIECMLFACGLNGKGWSSEMYDEMSVTFVLYFKKASSAEANYKLEN